MRRYNQPDAGHGIRPLVQAPGCGCKDRGKYPACHKTHREYEMSIKIAVAGKGGCGKTSITGPGYPLI